MLHSLAFAASTYEALQVLVQVAHSAPADVPPLISREFSALRAMQYAGVGPVPLACTSLSLFTISSVTMALAPAALGLWLLAFACWYACVVRGALNTPSNGAADGLAAAAAVAAKLHVAGAGQPTTSASRPSLRAACFAAVAAVSWRRLIAAAAVGCNTAALQPASFLAITPAGVMYALTVTAAVRVVVCTEAVVTLSEYCLRRSDGSTAVAALGISAAEGMTSSDAVLLATTFAAPQLAANRRPTDGVCHCHLYPVRGTPASVRGEDVRYKAAFGASRGPRRAICIRHSRKPYK